MKTCFVMQPFDGEKYDRRYAEIFKPAIEDTGLTSYRVDHDPSVVIPIEQVETGIRESAVCLAEISSDNPNVWFELGYAIASKKSVIMVCSEERTTKYPFDIQHRAIIRYKSESPSDFSKLRQQITERIKASLEKEESLQKIASAPPLAEVAGMSQIELMALAVIAGEISSFTYAIPAWNVKQKIMENGYTDLAANLGVRKLFKKGLIANGECTDSFGNPYDGYIITLSGWDWIEANESEFSLKTPAPKPRSNNKPRRIADDDDIPF